MDRRLQVRCPVCQGPAKEEDKTLRCRNSLCRHNHAHIKCPRCGQNEAEAITFTGGLVKYSCADCQHQWGQAAD